MKNLFATAGIALTSFAWAWTGSSCGFGAAQNAKPEEKAMAQAQPPIQPQSRSKHSAKDLEEFYLAEKVNVRGLGTSVALEKLREAYLDTCRQTGEVPLKLSFEVPAGHEAPLGVELREGDLDLQICYVAAAAKMRVERRGASYRFEAPQADEVAISSTQVAFVSRLPRQLKFSAKIFEVPAESNWVAPQTGNYDRKAFNQLAVSLATERGVDLRTLPSITRRRTEEGLIQIEGVKLKLCADRLGVGHLLESSLDLGKGTHLSDKGYVGDGGARVVVQKRPDGSRVILVVETTLLDATGKPVRSQNR